ncbi:MAG: flavin reductase family protein [Chitinophagaceae bacterium]|nr:flavin reductase family protein [Chitinophagaceae bacterium]
MKHISLTEINNWDRFYRGNFINSLSGFKSASLIGTMNKNGETNLAIFSNIIHLGADPALIAFQNRPKEAAPHTIGNIEATGVYTINHIQINFIEQAHQTSAKYAVNISEFNAVGLTAEFKNSIQAPFVAESNIKYALELKEIIPIQHNGTFLVIGAVTDIFINEELIEADGFIAAHKNNSICSLGIDGYYSTTFITRLPYAKP